MLLFRRLLPLSVLSACVVLFTGDVAQAQAASPSSSQQQESQAEPKGSTITYTAPATGVLREKAALVPTKELWKHPGLGIHIGVNGAGLEIAEPLGQHFNARVGGEYFRYTGDFTSDGAQINADLTVGGGKVALDYFPWHNGFHVSPQLRFAVQTAANVKVVVPAGQQISLNGADYVSSSTDPLHGQGYVDTKKTAVGVTVGYGNLSSRHGARWSFPVELGFYYIGQPNLTVTFTGSACDPTVPAAIGCQKVDADPGFQADLKRFIARQNHNLSYASFFPVASFGVGYRF